MKRILAAMLAVICLPAHATIITIDSDAYAAGTDVSNASPGVTLSNYTNRSGQASFEPLYVVNTINTSDPDSDFDGLVGSRTLGSSFNGRMPGPWDYGGPYASYSMFRADFAQATDFVEIWAPFYEWMDDAAVMWAFNANGDFLTGCSIRGGGGGSAHGARTGSGFRGPAMTEPVGVPCGEVLIESDCSPATYCNRVVTGRITRSSSDIAYVVVSGEYGVGSTGALVDRISYGVTSVPEPGSLALMGLGAIGAVVGRKRRLAFLKEHPSIR